MTRATLNEGWQTAVILRPSARGLSSDAYRIDSAAIISGIFMICVWFPRAINTEIYITYSQFVNFRTIMLRHPAHIAGYRQADRACAFIDDLFRLYILQ